MLIKLAAAAEACGGERLERSLAAGGLVIANRAKENAPRLTGNLKRSLHVGGHQGLQQPTDGTDVGGNSHTAVSATVLVGTNVMYAWYVEKGTSRMAAQPYLVPAFDECQEQAADTVQRAAEIQVAAALKA